MTRTLRAIGAGLLLLTICVAGPASAQTRLYAGAKSWYANWDLKIDRIEGATQTDYSAAFMTGPYLTLRIGKVATTVSYSTSLLHFTAETRNPGLNQVGFNMNRELKRDDINVILQYYLSSDVAVFANAKFLTYLMRDATVFINQERVRLDEKFTSSGFGGGIQTSVQFRDDRSFYSYLSVGAVYNSFNVVIVDTKKSELMYFLDTGVGYLVPETRLGLVLGLRGEHGGETKTIIGPVLGLFLQPF